MAGRMNLPLLATIILASCTLTTGVPPIWKTSPCPIYPLSFVSRSGRNTEFVWIPLTERNVTCNALDSLRSVAQPLTSFKFDLLNGDDVAITYDHSVTCPVRACAVCTRDFGDCAIVSPVGSAGNCIEQRCPDPGETTAAPRPPNPAVDGDTARPSTDDVQSPTPGGELRPRDGVVTKNAAGPGASHVVPSEPEEGYGGPSTHRVADAFSTPPLADNSDGESINAAGAPTAPERSSGFPTLNGVFLVILVVLVLTVIAAGLVKKRRVPMPVLSNKKSSVAAGVDQPPLTPLSHSPPPSATSEHEPRMVEESGTEEPEKFGATTGQSENDPTTSEHESCMFPESCTQDSRPEKLGAIPDQSENDPKARPVV
ncbi:uncharacterized protein LOC135812205 isoform X1 [Sycon ciliatum]|uniref:uncharacterized protein LOC135812205 isoform X1 n=1 Tax=Sycon ciliatum TaxID=27933 RepID=UPI0031F65D5E